MNAYPSTPKTLSFLITQSFRNYYSVWKATWLTILLIAVVKDFYIYWGGLPQNVWFRGILILVTALLIVYLWAVMLSSAHAVLSGSPLRWRQAYRHVYYKLSSIYAGLFALGLLLCVLFYFGYLLSHALAGWFAHTAALESLFSLIFIGLPLTFALVGICLSSKYVFSRIPSVVAHFFFIRHRAHFFID